MTTWCGTFAIGCVDPVCTPGASTACTCSDGSEGAQVCNTQGTALQQCECDAVDPVDVDAGVDDGGVVVDDGIAGLQLMHRLAGLWSGPTNSSTVVPDIPVMNMDLRPVGDAVLFARQDLDDANNLRFSFTIEDVDGVPKLVYRNGGYFQGVLRDSRTVVEHADDDMGVYRFCSLAGGCDYIDAVFTFGADDQLTFDVDVRGQPHIDWSATREAEATLPTPFPTSETPTGDTTQPFAPMPTLEVSASWTTPAPAGAQVLLALSPDDCPITNPLDCVWARNYVASVDEGASEVTIVLEQVHAGTYALNVVLDNDGNNIPNSGDAVQLPNQHITVSANLDDDNIASSSVSIPVSF